MNDESLQVIEEKDGSLTIAWDETDPRYDFLKQMTPQQQEDYFVGALNSICFQNKYKDAELDAMCLNAELEELKEKYEVLKLNYEKLQQEFNERN